MMHKLFGRLWPQRHSTPEEEYDLISVKYHEVAEKSDDREFLFVPTLLKYLPSLKGKSVLDIATGGGYWARLLKQQGAQSVVGIDISSEQIRIAEAVELKYPLGIRYVKQDARTLNDEEQYDVAFAAFLLHYSQTEEELRQMCKSIAASLRLGGTFMTLNANPDIPEFDGRKYFCTVRAEQGVSTGAPITVTLYDKLRQVEPFAFHYSYWSKEIYEEALTAAGSWILNGTTSLFRTKVVANFLQATGTTILWPRIRYSLHALRYDTIKPWKNSFANPLSFY